MYMSFPTGVGNMRKFVGLVQWCNSHVHDRVQLHPQNNRFLKGGENRDHHVTVSKFGREEQIIHVFMYGTIIAASGIFLASIKY